MKPSPIQHFCADGFRISMLAGSLVAAALVGKACGAFSIWAVIAVLVALALGGIFGAIFLFPLILAIGSRVNGSPFHEGDVVHILVGPYRDHVGRIYEMWPSRTQVRVEIGEQAKLDLADVFFYHEICRETDA